MELPGICRDAAVRPADAVEEAVYVRNDTHPSYLL